TSVRDKQIARLNHVKSTRNQAAVDDALRKLAESAASSESTGSGQHPMNLLKLTVDAARARATLGEISSALEHAWGRHTPSSQVVQGAYSATFAPNQQAEFDQVIAEVQAF